MCIDLRYQDSNFKHLYETKQLGQMTKKLQITDLSIFITIASTTLYIVFRNLGREAGSFAFLWAPLTLVLILLNRPIAFSKGPMKILLLYVITISLLQFTLWKNMDDWNQYRILYELYYLVVITVVLFYYLGNEDYRKLAILSKWAFIFILISLAGTNVALYFDPTIVRESARTDIFTPLQDMISNLTGSMSYSYVQSIVFLIPILVYHIKNKKKMVFSPKVLFVILLVIIITQIRSQVFANVLVTVLITILSILGSKKRSTSLITVTFVSIIFFSVPNSYYTDTLYFLSSKFDPNSEMYYKITDFANFIKNTELDTSTGAGARAERYPMLLEAFLAKPIWGHASYHSNLDIELGAHLYWMNRLAQWGIIGFLFFIFVLVKIYRSIVSVFDPSFKFYYFLSVVAFVLLGLTKVIGGREPWLMLILVIPGLYFLPLLEQRKNYKSLKKETFTPITAE